MRLSKHWKLNFSTEQMAIGIIFGEVYDFDILFLCWNLQHVGDGI